MMPTFSKSSVQWSDSNPTLKSGFIGMENDTGKSKTGDGATAWNDLDYIQESSVTVSTEIISPKFTGKAGLGRPEGVVSSSPPDLYWDKTNKVFYVKDYGEKTPIGWQELMAVPI